MVETVEMIERRFSALVEAVSAMMAEHERHAEAAASVRQMWNEFIDSAADETTWN